MQIISGIYHSKLSQQNCSQNPFFVPEFILRVNFYIVHPFGKQNFLAEISVLISENSSAIQRKFYDVESLPFDYHGIFIKNSPLLWAFDINARPS